RTAVWLRTSGSKAAVEIVESLASLDSRFASGDARGLRTLESGHMAEDTDQADSSPVVGTRSVDIVVYLILLALALLLGFDNWRTGMHWESDAPQAGYFPFYLSLLLGGASLFGLISKLVEKGTFETFVTHQQLRRVMQVFVPTLLFCVAMQW